MGGVRVKEWNHLKEQITIGYYDDLLREIYLDSNILEYQRTRYENALNKFKELFGEKQIEIYSAPGRTEIGGNHTDHQQGEVLAAAIHLDAIAIVAKAETSLVEIISDGYEKITISLEQLEYLEEEQGTTRSLMKGVLTGFAQRGYNVGGFQAYITSDVLVGAGLSSSAAFEILIGCILSGLYNDMQVSAVELAKIGQYAENVYFGKPCGLMDQMASAIGSFVHINFADKENPVVKMVECNIEQYGYSLCITDTKGSHADLTADYAAVPMEMKKVAAFFGKEVLRDITLQQLYEKSAEIREKINDRAFLRAIHFVMENQRVQQQVNALQEGDVNRFLKKVQESGDSSFKYLQNVYTVRDVEHQNLSVALAVSETILGEEGASRVHGGGFAGTIQAFVKKENVQEYKEKMEQIFGKEACQVLQIRPYGGRKVI